MARSRFHIRSIGRHLRRPVHAIALAFAGPLRRVWYRTRLSDSGGFSPLVTADDVVSAFRLLFGRLPDADGWKTYSTFIGRTKVSELVTCLMSSEEFRHTVAYQSLARPEHTDLSLLDVGAFRLFLSEHDVANQRLREVRSYEEHVTRALHDVLRPGMTVCNIGANVGYHALACAAIVGNAGRVVAFEALVDNARLVQLSGVANAFHNLIVLPFAIADQWQTCRYVRAQGTNGYIEVIAREGDASSTRLSDVLQAAPLDDFRSLIGSLDLLLMDIEGAEGLAAKGAMRILADSQPVIVTEFSPGQLERTSRMTGEKYLAIYRELGYSFDVIQFDGSLRCFGGDIERVCRYASEAAGSHIDLKCVPQRTA